MLVYCQSARYIYFLDIYKIWCMFVIFLSEGLFETLNQIICHIAKCKKQRNHENISGFKATYKKYSDFV